MRTAQVVIGAGFGDEGKGLLTDYYATHPGVADCLVVRHNGGAQAGHTVTTPDGQRHVFKHFGSGTLAGAATLLSRHFIVNPMVFWKEHAQLTRLGAAPTVYLDSRAPITTPYDMLINQAVETARGADRHGSVGYGINETVVRNESGYPLVAWHMVAPRRLADILREIRDQWVPRRLAELGYPEAIEHIRPQLDDPGIAERWVGEAHRLFRFATLDTDAEVIREHASVVFEGAQGLLLDQTRGYRFPFVTRSNTGLRNAVELAAEAGIGHLEVTYATRAYLTRHGAGPMPHETEGPVYPGIVDRTNITGPYQGHLRFAPLNLPLLRQAIIGDVADAASMGTGVRLSHGVAVTCLDQVPMDGTAQWVPLGSDRDEHATPVTGGPVDLLRAVVRATYARFLLQSTGPIRTDVRQVVGQACDVEAA